VVTFSTAPWLPLGFPFVSMQYPGVVGWWVTEMAVIVCFVHPCLQITCRLPRKR
jgi:apolipoprotein N-acyltransferase